MDNIARERRALELFDAMLDIDEEERAVWIAQHAGDDDLLRERLTQLARADSTNMIRTGGAVDQASEAEPPERIGAYRLEELIGTGGMGAVYSARRDKGDFDHEVAIKLVKQGLLSERLTSRFSRERQLLAQFSHPNIARLYDGGETEDGQPYIVMEKVDGVALNMWLEQAKAPLQDRLELFIKVCEAVGHAHSNLVIHRDLSPSNILVTPAGEPKLIDFGIALTDGEELGPAPGQKARPLQQLTLTPGYAAPERLRGEAATTLSDIYSAGRLLSLLVTKPRPPELQAIASKALAADPDDRYQSMAQMGEDVRRFLDRLPVEAFGKGPAYLARKFVLRNRLGVAGGVLGMLGAFGGVLLLADAWQSAERERDAAEARFAEVRALSNYLIFDLYDQLATTPGNVMALNDVADKAREYLDRLVRTPGATPELRLETALAYRRLSDVLGSPRGDNLGRREEAQAALETSLAQLRELSADYPDRADIREGLADTLSAEEAFAFIALDDTERAIEAGMQAASLYAELGAQGHKPEAMEMRRIGILSDVGVAYGWTDTPEQGVTIIREALAAQQSLVGTGPESDAAMELRAKLETNLFETLTMAVDTEGGSYDEAIAMSARAVATYEAVLLRRYEPDRIERALMITLYKRALTLASVDQEAISLPDLERAEAIGRSLLARDPANRGIARLLTSVLGQYASALAFSGNSRLAAEKAREVVEAKRRLAQSEPDNSARLRELAATLIVTGEVAETGNDAASACTQYREARTLSDDLRKRDALSDYDLTVVFADLPDRIDRTC